MLQVLHFLEAIIERSELQTHCEFLTLYSFSPNFFETKGENMLSKILLSFTVILCSSYASAHQFQGLLGADVSIARASVSPDEGPTTSDTSFNFEASYWHRRVSKPDTYIVARISLGDDSMGIAGGMEWNFNNNLNSSIEYGPGANLGYLSVDVEGDSEQSGFMVVPYFFGRFFVNNSNAFVGADVSYNLAFLDDGDTKVFGVTLWLGLGF